METAQKFLLTRYEDVSRRAVDLYELLGRESINDKVELLAQVLMGAGPAAAAEGQIVKGCGGIFEHEARDIHNSLTQLQNEGLIDMYAALGETLSPPQAAICLLGQLDTIERKVSKKAAIVWLCRAIHSEYVPFPNVMPHSGVALASAFDS